MIEYDREWYIRQILCRAFPNDGSVEQIVQKYNNDHWDKAIKFIFTHTHRRAHKKDPVISTVAIKIAERLNTEFRIEVFPIIFRTYAGHWMRTDGTYSWYMIDIHAQAIGSQQRAKKFAVKRNRVEFYYWRGDAELDIYEPGEPGYEEHTDESNSSFDQGVYAITGNGCFTAAPEENMPKLNMLALRNYLKETGKRGEELTEEEKHMFIIVEDGANEI